MSWYWYVPNDFHYFIIATLLLILYARNKKIFYYVFIPMNLAFWAVEATLIIYYDLGINMFDLNRTDDYYKYFYLKFYTRSSPFWLGLFAGILYSKFKRDEKAKVESRIRKFMDGLKNSRLLSYLSFFLGMFVMLAMTFLTYWSYDEPWHWFVRFLYNFFSKKVYVLALFFFCLPMMLGNITFMAEFLGADVFVPLGKLSFSVYIIHPLLVKFVIFNLRTPFVFDGMYIFLMGFAFVVASFTVAIFVCLLFEMPFNNARAVFKGQKKKAPAKKLDDKPQAGEGAGAKENLIKKEPEKGSLMKEA
jgi:peptidoglycan/LPS O-acetylase OafA/YrhL